MAFGGFGVLLELYEQQVVTCCLGLQMLGGGVNWHELCCVAVISSHYEAQTCTLIQVGSSCHSHHGMAINEGNEAPPELTPSEPEKRGEYPIPSATCAKVLLDYTPEGEYSLDQLKLLAGDVVYVHEKHPSGWWGGHKAGSNSTGWFPASILQPYIAQRIGEWADDEAQDPPTSPGAAGLLLASMPTATASTSASMKSPLCTDDRPVASPQGLAQAVRLSRKGSTGSAETTELQT
eukprot:1128376-Amphidinium_carterae.1